MKEKILITGVAGLLGSRLADWIISNNPSAEVIGVDDLSGGYIENVNEKVLFHRIDINDTEKLSRIFEEHKPKYVYHLAAYAAEGLSPFIRKFNYTNNLLSTAGIVNESIRHGVERLVFTSSLAVYGHGNNQIFDEYQIPCPIDPYGVAKYACEMDIRIAGEQHGLDWCIIRPHNVYGINQNIWDKYRNVFGIWMNQTLNGKPMTIFGDGNQTRAFSYIDDILEPLWNAATRKEASHEIINLGGIEEHSIVNGCHILRDVIGSGDIVHLEPRHEVKHSIPTWKKSEEILGFNHTTSLREGLTKMWNWARIQPKRPQFKWETYELDNGIYSFWR